MNWEGMEGSGRGSLKGLSQKLPAEIQQNHENPSNDSRRPGISAVATCPERLSACMNVRFVHKQKSDI
jgi:hypothetical protein